MTCVIKRAGKEVGKFRAPKIEQHGVNRFIWTLRDADGTLLGSIYLSTDKVLTVEPDAPKENANAS